MDPERPDRRDEEPSEGDRGDEVGREPEGDDFARDPTPEPGDGGYPEEQPAPVTPDSD